MKKSLIALAVLGAFAGAASAQSSVTLYGVVDVNVQRTDPKRGTTTDVAATTGVNGGHMAGNRWGLRGSEDLGGGLRAIFQLESGFNIDEGTLLTGGRLFHRQAYVGLAGNFGTVVAGRLAAFSSGTGAFDRFGTLDPFRTGYGLAGFGATMSGANALRADNAIGYVTPTMGGFSAGIGHTFHVAHSATPPFAESQGGSGNNNSGQFMYANYSAGPLYAVLTYNRIKLNEVPGAPTTKHLQIGAAYDLKVVRLSAAYAKEDDVHGLFPLGFSHTPPGTGAPNAFHAPGADATAWAIGASAPFGPHRLAASYQKRNVDAFGQHSEGSRTVVALGYEYSLSRRTTFYAGYSDVTDDGSLKRVNFGGQKQTTFGLSHTF